MNEVTEDVWSPAERNRCISGLFRRNSRTCRNRIHFYPHTPVSRYSQRGCHSLLPAMGVKRVNGLLPGHFPDFDIIDRKVGEIPRTARNLQRCVNRAASCQYHQQQKNNKRDFALPSSLEGSPPEFLFFTLFCVSGSIFRIECFSAFCSFRGSCRLFLPLPAAFLRCPFLFPLQSGCLKGCFFLPYFLSLFFRTFPFFFPSGFLCFPAELFRLSALLLAALTVSFPFLTGSLHGCFTFFARLFLFPRLHRIRIFLRIIVSFYGLCSLRFRFRPKKVRIFLLRLRGFFLDSFLVRKGVFLFDPGIRNIGGFGFRLRLSRFRLSSLISLFLRGNSELL